MSRKTPNHPPESDPRQPKNVIGARVTRLIRIIHLVQGGKVRTPGRLARRLGVSRRTVFRDVKTLQDAGVPIVSRPGKGYAVADEYDTAPLRLGAAEGLGLMLLARVARAMPDQPVLRPAVEAIDRIVAQLPPNVRQVYDDLMSQVSIATGHVSFSSDDEQHYRTLQYGIEERKICRAVYHALHPNGRYIADIHPLHLHFWQRAWYVLAFCEKHNEVRLLKLSRFEELEPTDRNFAPRPFSIHAYLDDAWGVMPEGRKYDVVIDFAPLVARNAADIRWHRTQETMFRADGSCEMRFRVNGLSEIKWWVLGYGDQAVVREPPELRRAVCETACAAAQHYIGG